MVEGKAVTITVNGQQVTGAYIRPVQGKKNRHRVAIRDYKHWWRHHWVTVNGDKIKEAA